MIKAFAPRDAGGSSWVLLSIVLMATFALVVEAQAQTQGPPPDAKAEEKPAAPPPPAAEPEPPSPTVESFTDPRVEKLLDNNFPQLGKPGGGLQVIRQVKGMAAGTTGVDNRVINEYIQNWMFDLTNRNNIRAVIDPNAGIPAGAASHFAIQVATDNLIEPILTARAINNSNFLTPYNRALLNSLPPLLENHYLARLEAIIVLSQTGSPDAIPVFVKQLNDKNQTVWVAMWAARGLTNIEQLTNFNLDPSQAVIAAKAVSDFLDREKKLPWPVQFRALEALGSLRQASTLRPANGQPEMATTAAQFLTNPDVKLMVRAEAGWALGMLQVQAGIGQYNFQLIAHSIGDVAVALGERVLEVYPKNTIQAEGLAGILMTQVYQAFEGMSNVRESGLLRANHPNANTTRPFIRQVSDMSKQVAGAAVKLVRGTAGQAKDNLQGLSKSVADLKAWLGKNQPANAWLVPNGPVFPVNQAQVVDAEEGGGLFAGAAAGREK